MADTTFHLNNLHCKVSNENVVCVFATIPSDGENFVLIAVSCGFTDDRGIDLL